MGNPELQSGRSSPQGSSPGAHLIENAKLEGVPAPPKEQAEAIASWAVKRLAGATVPLESIFRVKPYPHRRTYT